MGELWRRPGADYRARDGWTFESSAGVITPPTITNPSGDTIRVSVVQGFIRAEDDVTSALHPFYVSQTDIDFSGKANGAHYIYAEWNSGTPQLNTTTSETDISGTDEFLIGIVVKETGAYHITVADVRVYDIPGRLQHVLHEIHGVRRANHLGGLILGEDGASRYVTVSAGELYLSLDEYEVSSIDTDPGGGADTFDAYYGSFTKVTGLTQWPNTQYDNAGVLTTMTNNWYANLWFYLGTDGSLVMIYGTAQYANLTSAEAETAPASVPARLSEHGVLIGRIVFQKSASSAELIESAFTTTLGISAAADHGSLAGLTDDDHSGHPWLTGRAGGQVIQGGTAASEALDLEGTSHATPGPVNIGENDQVVVEGGAPANSLFVETVTGDIGIGTATPGFSTHIYRSGANAALVVERNGGALNYVNATATHGNFGTTNAFPLRLVSGGSWAKRIDTDFKVLERLPGVASAGRISWGYAAIDGTLRTIAADETPDVATTCLITWLAEENVAGTTANGQTKVNNGATANITVGTLTLQFAVAANGALTVQRTAGANTCDMVCDVLFF